MHTNHQGGHEVEKCHWAAVIVKQQMMVIIGHKRLSRKETANFSWLSVLNY